MRLGDQQAMAGKQRPVVQKGRATGLLQSPYPPPHPPPQSGKTSRCSPSGHVTSPRPRVSPSPRPRVPASPRLPVPPSPCPPSPRPPPHRSRPALTPVQISCLTAFPTLKSLGIAQL